MDSKCLQCVFGGNCRRQDTDAAADCRHGASAGGLEEGRRVALAVIQTEGLVSVLTLAAE